MHPGSSSSCSGWRKQDNNVVFGGGRGGCSNGGPICYCGMKSVVRTARTIKNRGKQFWGCPKFKGSLICVFLSHNGGEDECCNYFSWCVDHGVVETKTTANCEGKCESLLNREAMEAGWKKLGNRLNVLLGAVCVLVLVNIIVLTIVFLG
ncbi:hypothetical protein V8G54_017700 [Vigna mungo]|uniref:GRF-type domain-containing protein n=1 Tax=Vigna mungo TaxID=3915 RepID=A0AAQ3NMF2_VIGMU